MATHRELVIDWNMLDNDCNNWTLQDLQLAAELGRTLLERNEELETEVKNQQVVIEDQGQEIEFLTKQVNSMKEESASRSKIYEQLESSICELERTNSQLSRKHEIDKKRMQSMCENIEYLERKCEELNVTLQTMRNEQGKKSTKVNRSTYFSFGSDSSEEEMSSGFGPLGVGVGLFRKRSHSLQDLRDYTPSPDEFDSGNSNSPDLKTSEAEYINSLENKIELLEATKKEEVAKLRQLEAQIKLLIQENSNLQQQIVQMNTEKEEEISELRKHLQDSSNYNCQLNSSFGTVPLSSTRRNSDSNNSNHSNLSHISHPNYTPNGSSFYTNSHFSSSNRIQENSSIQMPFSSLNNPNPSQAHSSSPSTPVTSSINRMIQSFPSICKRCSAEINILNLVTSIENDNTDGNLYDWEFGNPDDDMEFSSLEHELARATGTPYMRDNRFLTTANSFNNNNNDISYKGELYNQDQDQRLVPSPCQNSNSNVTRRKSSLVSNISQNLALQEVQKSRSKKFVDFLRTNPSQIDIEEMDYENCEIFNIFFGHDDKLDKKEEEELDSPTPSGEASGVDDVESVDLDSFGSSGSVGSVDSVDSDRMDEDPCLIKDRKPEFAKNKRSKRSKGKRNVDKSLSSISTPTSSELEQNKESEVVVKRTNSKYLELPKRIPNYDEDEEVLAVSSAVGVSAQINKECDLNSALISEETDLNSSLEEESQAEEEKGCFLPYQKQESSSSGYESEFSSTPTSKLDSVEEVSEEDPSSEFSDSEPEPEPESPPSRSPVPEYKQILHSLFSIFNNSKRKYPIPMYPFIQEARRQSGSLIYQTKN